MFNLQNVSKFAKDVISRARTIDEIQVLLKQKQIHASLPNFPYPRLLLALDHEQKFFIADSNVQQVILI